MSNETKRDVFDKLLSEYVDDERRIDGLVYEPDQHIPELDRDYFINGYASALPDDLPVIPEAVGNQIVEDQGEHLSDELHWADQGALGDRKLSNWIADNENTFAIAWLYGVWRVYETGEIVKLEAEK